MIKKKTPSERIALETKVSVAFSLLLLSEDVWNRTSRQQLKLYLAYLNNFLLWTRVLKHTYWQYVEIAIFSK